MDSAVGVQLAALVAQIAALGVAVGRLTSELTEKHRKLHHRIDILEASVAAAGLDAAKAAAAADAAVRMKLANNHA